MCNGRFALAFFALALSCVACAENATSSAITPNVTSSSTYTTISATVNGTLTTFTGYAPYDCEWVSVNGNTPILAIYAYSGGCEYCGNTMMVYLSDTTLPGTETASCDATDHLMTYTPFGFGLYSTSTNFGGWCTGLQISSFNINEGATVSGSFSQATFLPSQEQSGSSVLMADGTFSCANLHLDTQ